MKRFPALVFALFVLLFIGCKEDKPICDNCENENITGEYSPRAFTIPAPAYLGTPIIPDNNPLTEQGIALGRALFFDPILSADSTMACAGCHFQDRNFTDGLAKSIGILGLQTKRGAMQLSNLVYLQRNFFWDGAAASLEDQALLPIEAHDELNDSWENVEAKLRRHPDYPMMFRAAFGISKKSEMTRELAVKAIAQFERTLISYNSKFDEVVWRNQGEFTEEEQLGKELFEVETAITIGHPGCTHCHSGPNFTDNNFHNNGLDNVPNLNAFADKGRGGVTGVIYDNGKFRTPSLRNIALSAPYMHDGRFQTLEEVLDHYASGGHGVENENVNIRPFDLSAEEKRALIAFLHTLTDSSFIQNPAFGSPF